MTGSLFLVFSILAQTGTGGRQRAELSASLPGPQPVGKPVAWTARYPGTKSSGYQYRWSVAVGAGPERVIRDFGPFDALTYTPMQAGPYTVRVQVRNAQGGMLDEASRVYTAASLLSSNGAPKVTPSAHPLVAIYSTRCQAGRARVQFALATADLSKGMATPYVDCQGTRDLNITVAGMRPDSLYHLQEFVDAGAGPLPGPVLNFQTGSAPPLEILPVPKATLQGNPKSPEPVILAFFVNTYGFQPQCPIAYDTAGNMIWYYLDPDLHVDFVFRTIAGGNFIGTTDYDGRVLREVDLMGNLVRETTSARVSEQMKAMGKPGITQFSHDALRLPGGDTAVIATMEQFADQGDGVVDVLGDAVVVLDADWQVKWVWNPFVALDVKRQPIGGAQCGVTAAGCPILTLATTAIDWTHANSLWYTAADHNLLISVRNQDWLVKVDFRDGAGDGKVLWRMGPGGDFQAISGDANPWFTHQHDATLFTDGRMTIYDNGNTRVRLSGGLGASRGQIWQVDEAKKTATLLVSTPLTGYSSALGAAQFNADGNLTFTSGFLLSGGASDVVETSAAGVEIFHMGFFTATYRAMRIPDLYTPPY